MAAEISLMREANEGVPGADVLPDKIIVIGDPATVMGFRLAGVAEAYVAEGKNAEKKLAELLDRENAGIIIVTEPILAALDWRLRKRIEAIAKPVVVAVPDKNGSTGEAGKLSEMIKRALGFELGGK